jgi:hypothetical protein
VLRGHISSSRKAIVGFAIAAVLGATVPTASATAEGLLNFLFGGFRRSEPPVGFNRPDDLLRLPTLGDSRSRSARGAAFCVRLCDGRHFPIQGQRNVSTAAQCSSFCPASTTEIFFGRSIEHAASNDGRRYADLPNAFVYRERIVPGCTCDGRNTTGLAQVPLADDPTLRNGDIVATSAGLSVYKKLNPRQQPVLTPVGSAKLPKNLQSQLAGVKVSRAPKSADAMPATASPGHTTSGYSNRHRLSAREP